MKSIFAMSCALLALMLSTLVGCGGTIDGRSGTEDGGGATADGGRGGPDGGNNPAIDGAILGGSDAGSPPGDGFFPAGSWMYQRVDGANADVHANSATVTQWLANNGGWGFGRMQIDFSIEVLQATSTTPFETFNPTGEFYAPDCDNVAMPVPVGGNLEGESGYACDTDGDCHLIVVDDSTKRLYEMWRADIRGGTFNGGCLAVWDMTRVYAPQGRGEQCTSADAAGFPIAPLLFTADELAAGEIAHAIRFILPNPRMRDGFYVRPATHAGGPSGPTNAPVYGSRWRLRADFDLSSLPNEGARIVARAMQRYGMVLADGGNVALTGRSDRFTTAKWAGQLEARDLDTIEPTDFEVIDTGPVIELTYDCVRTAY